LHDNSNEVYRNTTPNITKLQISVEISRGRRKKNLNVGKAALKAYSAKYSIQYYIKPVFSLKLHS